MQKNILMFFFTEFLTGQKRDDSNGAVCYTSGIRVFYRSVGCTSLLAKIRRSFLTSRTEKEVGSLADENISMFFVTDSESLSNRSEKRLIRNSELIFFERLAFCLVVYSIRHARRIVRSFLSGSSIISSWIMLLICAVGSRNRSGQGR